MNEDFVSGIDSACKSYCEREMESHQMIFLIYLHVHGR